MKVKAQLLFILLAFAPATYSFGQINCPVGGTTNLVCQFPASAQTLANYTYGSNSAQGSAIISAAQTASLPINASIATQLTQLPIPSASVGVVSLKRKGSDVPVPFDNLGPIITDRPDTVGAGHLFAGFAYQHFNFNSLDGNSLANLSVSFVSTPTVPAGQAPTTYYGAESNNISFQLNQYVALLTYGVSRSTDVSVVIPINSVSINVATSKFQAFYYTYSNGQYTNLNPVGAVATTVGSANGLGDISVGAKHLLIGGEGTRAAISAGGSVRLPTGSSLNYLGSGATGGNLYGLFEYRARLAPHLKVGYQWNDVSPIMNATSATHYHLPGGVQYAGGFDVKIFRALTAAVDVLGNQFINTPSLTVSTVTLNPVPAAGTAPATFQSVSTPFNTYSTTNLSTGVKWSPLPHFLVYGNALKQLNNVGLRSDIVPQIGISYNLKLGK